MLVEAAVDDTGPTPDCPRDDDAYVKLVQNNHVSSIPVAKITHLDLLELQAEFLAVTESCPLEKLEVHPSPQPSGQGHKEELPEC